jgi:hypothetical protein
MAMAMAWAWKRLGCYLAFNALALKPTTTPPAQVCGMQDASLARRRKLGRAFHHY